MAKNRGGEPEPGKAVEIGAELGADVTTVEAGQGVGKGHRRLKDAEARREVDASNPKHTRPPADWPVQELARVRSRSDADLKRDAVAILAYQQLGKYGWSKIATLMGQTPHWVKTTLRVARERHLVDDVLAAARNDVEHNIVPDAVKSLARLVRRDETKAVLGTLQGVGVLAGAGAEQATKPVNLQVNIVVAPGENAQVIDPTNIVGVPSVIHAPPVPMLPPGPADA